MPTPEQSERDRLNVAIENNPQCPFCHEPNSMLYIGSGTVECQVCGGRPSDPSWPKNRAIPSFVSTGWFEVAGRGRVATTVLDRDTRNFEHLLHKLVSIDGALYTCYAVERHPHGLPHYRGERIGLWVNQINPSETG